MRAVAFEFFFENLRSKDSVTRFRPPIFWLKRLYLGPTGINRIKLFRKLFCFCKDIRLQRSKIMCHVDVRIVNLGCPRGQRLQYADPSFRENLCENLCENQIFRKTVLPNHVGPK